MDLEEIAVSAFSRLLHPYPTFLVSCAGPKGEGNVIAIAWLIPVSVHPPLLALAVQPGRYSYGLIVGSGEFTVNVVSCEKAETALWCGRRSGRDVDKIAALGLTTAPGRVVGTPVLVEDGVAFLECRLQQEVEAGDHALFIAEVVAAYARPDFLRDNLRNLEAAPPLLHVGGNRFTTTVQETLEPPLRGQALA
jgi:flavin reductase (DIM6/NTAB) family NADH-FMN oxidoreductase RutF